MDRTIRTSAVIWIAVSLAAMTLLPLTADRSYLVPSMLLVAVVCAIGAALRRLRMPGSLTLSVQLLAVIAFAVGIGVSSGDPQRNPVARTLALFPEAAEHMRTQAAPMVANPGITLLFVTAVGVIAILTFVLVVEIDRAPWALAPPLTLYLVPALGLREDVPWWGFVLIAVGYVLILLNDGLLSANRWSRNTSSADAEGGSQLAAVARAGTLVAIPTLVLTLLVGAVLPLPGQAGLGGNRGRGNDGPLQLSDPTLDLKRNLNQPEDRTVLTYTTDRNSATYLRMASLPVFNSNGWQAAAISLQPGPALSGVPGLDEDAAPRRTTIQVGDFGSEYLPTPYAPRAFRAEGQWSYDPVSLMVIGTGDNRGEAIRNLSYEVDSVDVVPDGAKLSTARAGVPTDANLTASVPPDLPSEIIDLSLEVTKGANTPALKAAAIQEYLRSDRFTYSTEQQAGSSYQQLSDFLTKDRRGYCEQFAASMAVMARVVGIPSRVSVGFLPGTKVGDHYEVGIRDMHAWPELYFEGYGWVRFEPTPSVVTGNPPSWTVVGEEEESSSESPSATATEGPSDTPTDAESVSVQPSEPSASTEPAPTGSIFPWDRLLAGIGIFLGIAILVSLPAVLRGLRRRRRLDAAAPLVDRVENVWRELQDTAIDLGTPWPSGSPREMAVAGGERLESGAARAVWQLGTLVERARYAEHFDSHADVSRLATDALAGMTRDLSWDGRLLITVWPRSLFVGLTDRIGAAIQVPQRVRFWQRPGRH